MGVNWEYSLDGYVVYPIRVMETVREYTGDTPMLAAALLHDVVEDTSVSAGETLQFFQSLMGREIANRTLSYAIELMDVFTKAAYPQLSRRARKSRELARLALTSPLSSMRIL